MSHISADDVRKVADVLLSKDLLKGRVFYTRRWFKKKS